MSRRHLAALAACGRIAARQHGLISRHQAIEAGLSPDAIDRLVADEGWKRVRPAVFALWVPSSREGKWRHRLAAAALWLGSEAAVSHRAAGLLHEVDGVTSAPLEFSTLGRRRAGSPGLVVHRIGLLLPSDVMILDGVRVTTAARTIVDLASVLDWDGLEAALESLLRRGPTTIDDIQSALSRSPRTTPGRGVLAEVLEMLPAVRTESYLETLAWQCFRSAGMELPERQYRILDENGREVARTDFAFVAARLVVEADGYENHSRPKDWKRDRARQNALLRLGWDTYRITWDDVVLNGHKMAAEIAEIVRARIAERERGSAATLLRRPDLLVPRKLAQ